MTDLADFAALVPADHGLAVVSVLRPDSTISASVVNAGVLRHPVTGEQVVAFVSRGDARRLSYLRAAPRVTVVLRGGWQWAAGFWQEATPQVQPQLEYLPPPPAPLETAPATPAPTTR